MQVYNIYDVTIGEKNKMETK